MLLPDAIFIAVISFTTSISIVNFYSNKYKYKTNTDKELFALGMSNLGSSFFQCFSSCAALARCAIFDSSGGSSQIVSIVSCGLTLCVILWIAPLFEKLPMACLAAIIVSALYNLLKQMTDIGHYWKTNKYELVYICFYYLPSIYF
jgi:SulP family sulfate permease